MTAPEQIAAWLGNYPNNEKEAVAQVKLRQNLAKPWNISPGNRILEIGCGQGDCTAVLADLVGENGKVVAIDSAPVYYGKPRTLAESQAELLKSPVGSRIEFHNYFNLLNRHKELGSEPFDAVVMANCSWYFASQTELEQTLILAKTLAKKLCFSEWDLMVGDDPDKACHSFAVEIQSILYKYKVLNDGNVKIPMVRKDMVEVIKSCGWNNISLKIISSLKVSDNLWEIQNTLAMGNRVLKLRGAPQDEHERLIGIYEIFEACAGRKQKCLDCFSLTAD